MEFISCYNVYVWVCSCAPRFYMRKSCSWENYSSLLSEYISILEYQMHFSSISISKSVSRSNGYARRSVAQRCKHSWHFVVSKYFVLQLLFLARRLSQCRQNRIIYRPCPPAGMGSLTGFPIIQIFLSVRPISMYLLVIGTPTVSFYLTVIYQ